MASNCFKSIHHHQPPLRWRHSIDCSPSTASSFCLRPKISKTAAAAAATPFLSHPIFTTFSVSATSPSSTTTPSTSQAAVTFDLLQQHLSSKDFRQADEETRRLLIFLAGEAAQKRGYVFFSEMQFIPGSDLKAIDVLWRKHSDGKFGYSVQRKLLKKVNKNFTNFFLKVGWMKKLDTEVEQYNYRSFPTEFMWENSDETPAGHLPLTNALRGTQLLNNILSHPAFEADVEEVEEDDGKRVMEEEQGIENGGLTGGGGVKVPLSNRGVFKTDYSF